MTAQSIIDALYVYSNREKAAFYPKFFKAIPGGYGEGDRFLGVTVPNQRIVSGRFANKTTEKDLQQLIESPFHEVRLTALMILVAKFSKASEKGFWADFYLRNIRYVNNWDLVDSSAHQILGAWLWDKERTMLYEMAKTGKLWEQRIAIMSTFCFIRRKDFGTTFGLAEMLLTHPHDLIHKATGWMLREVGKRDFEAESAFLAQHYREMPRTMLRYAIEKFPAKEKAFFMQKT